MFYKLKSRFLLRGWQKLPYAVADDVTKRTQFIQKKAFDALQLCDGKIDLSLPLISQEIRDIIPVLVNDGVIEECAKGDTIEPRQAYHLYPARYIRTAHWSITGHCNYRCKHCYMSAPDAKFGELSHERSCPSCSS